MEEQEILKAQLAAEVINSVENIEELEQREGIEWLIIQEQLGNLTAALASISEATTAAMAAMTAAQVQTGQNYQTLLETLQTQASTPTHSQESEPEPEPEPKSPAKVEPEAGTLADEVVEAAHKVEEKTKKRLI